MAKHKTGTREEWLAARIELLKAEKEHTRKADELAWRRRELPWVKIEKDYRFESEEGKLSLKDMFKGRSQLIVYQFMFGPNFEAGCPSCSSIADGFNGFAVHLAHHDVMLWSVSRAPYAKLRAFKQRMGWSFPWASSFESDFNHDFGVASTDTEFASGRIEYNFAPTKPPGPVANDSPQAKFASLAGTDWQTFARERPGLSVFALQDGAVHHTYSAYARGLDGLWGMYQWLDRAPLGRNEEAPGPWFKHHDRYGG